MNVKDLLKRIDFLNHRLDIEINFCVSNPNMIVQLYDLSKMYDEFIEIGNNSHSLEIIDAKEYMIARAKLETVICYAIDQTINLEQSLNLNEKRYITSILIIYRDSLTKLTRPYTKMESELKAKLLFQNAAIKMDFLFLETDSKYLKQFDREELDWIIETYEAFPRDSRIAILLKSLYEETVTLAQMSFSERLKIIKH